MIEVHIKEKILADLHVRKGGLNQREVQVRRESFGFNEIAERREPWWKLFLAQFQDVMVYILLGAIAVSLIVPVLQNGGLHQDNAIDAMVILAIVILNAVFGFSQEWRAENAIAMLKKLSAPQVKVKRDGVVVIIPSRELVPDDVILVEAGDRINADARLIESSGLEIDESTLTGESIPVTKQSVFAGDVESGLIYSGTLVTRGSGEAVVAAIGMETQLGRISAMMMTLKSPPTPLQLQLKKVGEKIGLIVLALCVMIFLLGIFRGMKAIEVFFVAVSLAVAAVPEGLPAIVTVCLALGVQRMIKKNALIRRLDAIETLGNVNVICSDKTGTITENRMKIVQVWLSLGVTEKRLAQIGASCNRALLPNIGDPTELALLRYAEQLKIDRIDIDKEELPFTSENKYMVTIHNDHGKVTKFAKGAPEVVATMLSPSQQEEVLRQNAEMTRNGLRVLAMVYDEGKGYQLAGLMGMLDPPRKGVKEAIALAREAGIRTIMITGDNAETAAFISRDVGISSEGVIDGKALETMNQAELLHKLKTVSIFARVQPAHKVKILEALQSEGNIVAMTGDGINDAPALKRSHVGMAMGARGTDVAREAGAMILTDDNYVTIIAAIHEGRRIYDNIRKFIIFLLRANVGEVLIIASAMLLNMPLPLLPLHILWMNLVTDSFPALALSAESSEVGIMKRPPRKPTEGILSNEILSLFVAGILNTIASLWVFQMVLDGDPTRLELARTATLTTTVVFQMLLAISTRSRLSIFQKSPFSNFWLWGAIALSLTLHFILLATPLASLFNVTPLSLLIWQEIGIICLVGFILFEVYKTFHTRWTGRPKNSP